MTDPSMTNPRMTNPRMTDPSMTNPTPHALRPATQIPPMTGLVGLGVLLIGVVIFHQSASHIQVLTSGVLTLFVMCSLMILTEARARQKDTENFYDETFYRLSWNRFWDALNIDLFIKIYGLVIILLTAWFFYSALPFYQGEQFVSFFSIVKRLWPYVVISGFVYVWVTHAVQKNNRDSLWHFGLFFCLWRDRQSVDREQVKQQALSWVIKLFFWPLMFSFFCDWWGRMITEDLFFEHRFPTFQALYDTIFNLFYLIDTAFATIGYGCTFYLLDTHIRQPETRAKGWVVTLIFYNPFINTIMLQQFAYADGLEWGQYFQDFPLFYVVYGTTILCLLAVYTGASVSMGLRLSNLTYRGITTWGPYAVTKHPAYLSKCLSWWLIEIPFIAASPWLAFRNSVMLGIICALYGLRARYEEQMLARLDPMYVEYQNYIRTTGGLWPRAKRLYRAHIVPLFHMLDAPR